MYEDNHTTYKTHFKKPTICISIGSNDKNGGRLSLTDHILSSGNSTWRRTKSVNANEVLERNDRGAKARWIKKNIYSETL